MIQKAAPVNATPLPLRMQTQPASSAYAKYRVQAAANARPVVCNVFLPKRMPMTGARKAAATGISTAREEAKRPSDIAVAGIIKDCSQKVLKTWEMTKDGQRLSDVSFRLLTSVRRSCVNAQCAPRKRMPMKTNCRKANV